MPQAIVDPDELNRFIQNLTQFKAQLVDSMSRIQGQFASLGDTWRDQEQAKFAQEFQQTMQVLHRFNRVVDDHIPYLRRKEKAARDYLNQR